MAFHQGRQRQAADLYKKSFQKAPSHSQYRYHIFHGYVSILKERYFTPEEERDFDFLLSVKNNTKEESLVRCQAAHSIGLLRWDQGDRNEAAAFYRDAIRYGEQATATERRVKIITNYDPPRPDGTIVGEQTVGAVLDPVVREAKGNLGIMEDNDYLRKFSKMKLRWNHGLRSDGTRMPSTARMTKVPQGTGLSQADIGHMLSVGGKVCDSCGATREELGEKHLLSCARCHLAYYCSKDCQAQQWRAGHKQHCRKPGQVEMGDYVLLTDLKSQAQLNGTMVLVEDWLEEKGRYMTKIQGPEKQMAVKPENLKRLRPLK